MGLPILVEASVICIEVVSRGTVKQYIGIIVLSWIHDIVTLCGPSPKPAHDSGWISRLLLGKSTVETSTAEEC